MNEDLRARRVRGPLTRRRRLWRRRRRCRRRRLVCAHHRRERRDLTVTRRHGSRVAPKPDGADATSADTGAATGDTAAVEISDEQAADCAAFEELNESLPDVDAPAVGEEISDEYKDEARSAIEQLEDLDLQSDEAQAARDSLVDDINAVVDADTMTDELQALGASEELIAFGQICAAGAAG